MTTPTDLQLQLALAKMLPEKIIYSCGLFTWINSGKYFDSPEKGTGQEPDREVEDTEWLHVCWLVEQTLNESQQAYFYGFLLGIIGPNPLGSKCRVSIAQSSFRYCHASWQQRAIALCKVKGVEIV